MHMYFRRRRFGSLFQGAKRSMGPNLAAISIFGSATLYNLLQYIVGLP